MRRAAGLASLALAVALALTGPARAQEAATPDTVAVLVLDQDRLFLESRFGQAVLSRHKQAVEALQAENRRIEAALEAEERELTERRSTLPAAEFSRLAADFDDKAEGIRKAQGAKSDDIKARLDAEQRTFAQTVRPVLEAMVRRMGAFVVLDARLAIFSVPGTDITDRAIAEIDTVLGDGPKAAESGTAAAPAPAPAATP
jgi:Skp family chaperone for outer membrane proteins